MDEQTRCNGGRVVRSDGGGGTDGAHSGGVEGAHPVSETSSLELQNSGRVGDIAVRRVGKRRDGAVSRRRKQPQQTTETAAEVATAGAAAMKSLLHAPVRRLAASNRRPGPGPRRRRQASSLLRCLPNRTPLSMAVAAPAPASLRTKPVLVSSPTRGAVDRGGGGGGGSGSGSGGGVWCSLPERGLAADTGEEQHATKKMLASPAAGSTSRGSMPAKRHQHEHHGRSPSLSGHITRYRQHYRPSQKQPRVVAIRSNSLRDWGIPEAICDGYMRHGVTALHDWQVRTSEQHRSRLLRVC